MVTIPSLTKILTETEKVPNVILEKAYSEIGRYNGIRRYGRVKEIPEAIEVEEDNGVIKIIPFRKEVLTYIREAINERNRQGDYFFNSRSERKRLHRVNLNPAW
jgi:hypothetical protein